MFHTSDGTDQQNDEQRNSEVLESVDIGGHYYVKIESHLVTMLLSLCHLCHLRSNEVDRSDAVPKVSVPYHQLLISR